jgi:hypothetical protein
MPSLGLVAHLHPAAGGQRQEGRGRLARPEVGGAIEQAALTRDHPVSVKADNGMLEISVRPRLDSAMQGEVIWLVDLH